MSKFKGRSSFNIPILVLIAVIFSLIGTTSVLSFPGEKSDLGKAEKFQQYDLKNQVRDHGDDVNGVRYVPDEVLVKFKRNISVREMNQVKKEAGLGKTLQRIGSKGKKGVHLIKLKPDQTVSKVIKKLKTNSLIVAAEPNYIYTTFAALPNDPYFTKQWGLNNTGQATKDRSGIMVSGTPNADINAPEAWEIEKGVSNPVTVAVIESGVDVNHPDLAGKFVGGYNFAGISQFQYNGWWNLGEPTTRQTIAQSIKGTGQNLTHIGVMLAKVGTPNQNITVSIRNSLSGGDLASFTVTPGEVRANDPGEVYKQLSSTRTLASGTTYYIVIQTTNNDSANYYKVYANSTLGEGYKQDPYRDGQAYLFDGSSSVDDDLFFHTNPNANPRDDNGHGTLVSGIIGASTNNGVGIAGVSHGVKIMPIKACDSSGFFKSSDVISAIHYAADHGARVINMSFGGPQLIDSLHTLVQEAVDYAYTKGVVMFAAVGNNGDGTLAYPAAYNHVIGVGATTNRDQKYDLSNYNASVDITAPGLGIYSTMPTYDVAINSMPTYDVAINYALSRNYDYLSGTSMASPMAAGLAALMLSYRPALTPDQVEQFMKQNADDLGAAGRDDYFGYGRINAYKTLSSLGNVSGSSTGSNNTISTSTGVTVATGDNQVTLSWSASNMPDLAGYRIYRSSSPNFSQAVKIAELPKGTTTYTDTSVTNGNTYYYWIVPYNTTGTEGTKIGPITATVGQAKVFFKDVPVTYWAYSYIYYLAEKGIVSGYPDNTFRPANPVTRAEFSKMICLAMGWTLVDPATASFPDVAKSYWAYKYIETARAHGAVIGYPDGS
ncbi:MAG TPA: S8 family serine peptidase, partial [Anaerolineae bacterium]|nr:S8 family serine peptidase [Anaerolineae bacterium]